MSEPGHWPKKCLNRCIYGDAHADGAGSVGWGRRPSSKQADDPGRAIKIVALTGQLYATVQLTPDHDCTRYSKNAWRRTG